MADNSNSGGYAADAVLASRAMPIGAEAMTAELEMIVDPAVDGQEKLRVTRRLKRSRSRRRIG
jgi:hypothetical protein